MEKAESLLKDIGMKEYEAKAFVTVINCGICSAEQVSKMSNIPLTRVYETMQSLQKLGLITVLNTRPKKYRLVSVDALTNLIDEKKRKMSQEIERSNAIVKEIKSIIPRKAKEDSEEVKEGFWIFKGMETVIRKVLEEERKAKKTIFYFSDDFGWFPRFRKIIEGKLKEGVKVKVLMNLNKTTEKTVEELRSMGVDVRGWDVKGLRGDIVDGKVVHLISKIPRSGYSWDKLYGKMGSDEEFLFDCLSTENPIIVNMVMTYHDVFWWRGEKIQTKKLRARV